MTLKEHHGESEDCVIFGVVSLYRARALLFNIMLPNGAVLLAFAYLSVFPKIV